MIPNHFTLSFRHKCPIFTMRMTEKLKFGSCKFSKFKFTRFSEIIPMQHPEKRCVYLGECER